MTVRETEKELETLVASADLSCLKCETQSFKDFEHPITYLEFVSMKSRLICPVCNHVYSSIPILGIDKYSKQNQISQEDWKKTFMIKYCKLYHVVKERMPILWDSLEFELSILRILKYKRLHSTICRNCIRKP